MTSEKKKAELLTYYFFFVMGKTRKMGFGTFCQGDRLHILENRYGYVFVHYAMYTCIDALHFSNTYNFIC